MLPLITDRDIEKAARYLRREHGEAAGAHAERHARDLRRDGLDDTAEAWERVAQRLGADPPELENGNPATPPTGTMTP